MLLERDKKTGDNEQKQRMLKDGPNMSGFCM